MGVPRAHPVPAHVQRALMDAARVLAAPIPVRPVAQILVLQYVTMGVEDVLEVAQADAMARAGILVQAAVAVRVHKILVLVRGVGIIVMELVLVVAGLALVVRVLIQYMMHIDFLGGKMIKIKISKELSDYIESLQFEVNRTKEIVAFMLSSPGYDTHTNTFAQWEKDNQEAYAKLCLAKNKLEHEVIPKLLPKDTGAVRSWSLDFYTHEVIVEAADAQEN